MPLLLVILGLFLWAVFMTAFRALGMPDSLNLVVSFILGVGSPLFLIWLMERKWENERSGKNRISSENSQNIAPVCEPSALIVVV